MKSEKVNIFVIPTKNQKSLLTTVKNCAPKGSEILFKKKPHVFVAKKFGLVCMSENPNWAVWLSGGCRKTLRVQYLREEII